jgi:NAD(P)H-nitrite reductase large subunit
MTNVDYLILGGGAAGTTAAETIRQMDPKGSIMIVEAEPETLYSKIMLTDLLKGTANEAQLHLRQAAQYALKHVELKFALIKRIDLDTKTATLANDEQLQGKQLLLALGTKPRPLAVPGSQLKGVYHLRDLNNTRQAVVDLPNVQEVVIVGGGFIGLEAYEAMMNRRIKMTMIVRDSWYFSPRISQIEGQMISDIVAANGVNIHFEEECGEIIGATRVEKIKTKKGLELPCQMVLLGIGVVPNLDLVAKTALKVDDQGIAVNRYLETNLPGIWAAGDIANFDDVISGKKHCLGNWSNAVGQGLVAGQNMAAANLGQAAKKEFRIVTAYTVTAPGINLSFLGDTSDGIECEAVLLSDKNSFIRLFVDRDEGNLVGAIMLNNPPVLGVLHRTITSQADIRSKIQAIQTSPRNIATILT